MRPRIAFVHGRPLVVCFVICAAAVLGGCGGGGGSTSTTDLLAAVWTGPGVNSSGPANETNTMLISVKADHSDRKSTRLNSSHITISYAVFCLKKKKHPETV